LKEFVEIKERNQVDITIPYVNIANWCRVQDSNITVGRLYVIVVDKLVAPATVASTVDIITEIAGAEDFELSGPMEDAVLIPSTPWQYQSNLNYNGSEEITSGYIGDSKCSSDLVLDSELCIGEKVSSLRQLIKRFDLVGSGNAQGINIRPYAIEYGKMTDASTYASTSAWNDNINFFAPCFTFSRGGVRLRIYPKELGGVKAGAVYLQEYGGGPQKSIVADAVETWSMVTNWKHTAVQFFDFTNTIAFDVQVPMYNLTHTRNNRAEICQPTAALCEAISGGNMNSIYVHALVDASSAGYYVYRAGAEDYSLGGFISCPPLAVGHAA